MHDLRTFLTGNSLQYSGYIAIDRDRLIFGVKDNTALLETIANCQCIENDVKAVVREDPAGASLIVLSDSKLEKLGRAKKRQMLDLLGETDAIRRDVQRFSRDISLEERIRRDVYKSRFEVEHQAA
jgi:hypothetical protein